jgi:phenylacetate-CoA ligase
MHPFNMLSLLQLLRNQWKSPDEIKNIQDRKLRRLVQHAYSRVPYYRHLFDSVGIKPQDILGVEDLPKIPMTSRELLMSLPREEILAQGIDLDQCRSTRTSGCTHTPLRIFHRREDFSLTNLGWARTYFAHGLRPWHRIAEFGGSRYAERSKSWYEYLGLMRRKILVNSDNPEAWIAGLKTWKAHALIGYSSTLKLLAMTIAEQTVARIRPQVVFSCSELLDEGTRQLLGSVFQSRVIDIYGSEEGRCIAWECGQCSGYHINADLVIVEFLRDGKPVADGEDGEIVITNLHSFAMPFIRYKQADVGVPVNRQAICGRGLPLMAIVKGRLDDFVVLRNGRKISPQFFYYAIAPIAGIVGWRVVQKNIGELRVEVVPARGPGQSRRPRRIRQRINENLRQVMGEDMKLSLEIVNSIPRDQAEKFRSVVSLVERGGNFHE